MVRIHTDTAEETEHIGRRLADTRPSAAAAAVVYLRGELGAGKTTFARGFLRACGVTGPVRSPTYTLLELYPQPGATLLHVDLFRLRAPPELESLGLRDWARPGCLWLVEWPERGQGGLPAADLALEFTATAAGHDIAVEARSPEGHAWLARDAAARAPPT